MCLLGIVKKGGTKYPPNHEKGLRYVVFAAFLTRFRR